MRQLRTLVWKETREALIYLWIGLFVFLGLPTIGGIEEYFRRLMRFPFHLEAAPWIVVLGGVLAVFVAVGATCRDLSPRLMDFWTSRPVSPWRWMTVKFVVGWIVTELACMVPALAALGINREFRDWALVAWLPYLWSAVYAVAFLAGCLVRRTAHAAMLGLASLLLLWFLPTIVPWLSCFNVTAVWTSERPQLLQPRFAGSMLAVTAVAAVTALLVAQRNWRVESNYKLMYASIAAACLILLGSLTLQLGTNLPQLAKIDLNRTEYISELELDGDQGWLITKSQVNYGLGRQYYSRSIQLTPNGFVLGDAQPTGNYTHEDSYGQVPHHHGIQYLINVNVPPNRTKVEDGDELKLSLWRGMNTKDVALLWPYQADEGFPQLVFYRDRLFVVGRRLAVFDISDPLRPKDLGRHEVSYRFGRSPVGSARVELLLPPLPDVPPQGRLDVLREQSFGICAMEGEIVCFPRETGGLVAYHVTKLTEKSATLELFAVREPPIVERIFGLHATSNMKLANGLLYVASTLAGAVNNSVNVYDVRQNLKLVGHFAAPGVGDVFPLPDGRALIGWNKLYLVGPPPKR